MLTMPMNIRKKREGCGGGARRRKTGPAKENLFLCGDCFLFQSVKQYLRKTVLARWLKAVSKKHIDFF